MPRPSRLPLACTALLLGGTLLFGPAGAQAQPDPRYEIHDTSRPQPRVVAPGAPAPEGPAPIPSDAVVLFDGNDLSKWVHTRDERPAEWTVENGYLEVAPGTGGIRTKEGFGDVQLHLEWMAPPPEGEGQGRGNSGVFLMGRYEVQVLDTYENQTYPDGQAGSVYGQYPPLVNANRPPGEWQTYDIIFRRPRFAADGTLVDSARVTVVHNGILVQDHVPLTGPTGHYSRPPYEAHPDRLPLSLQDHSNPVRFRNIWVRELE